MPSSLRNRTAGRHWRWITATLVALLSATTAQAATESPLADARQLVVVVTDHWDSTQASLQAFQQDGGQWRPHGSAFSVALGRNGSAWGVGRHPAQADGPHKREGDGRSPAGIFTIGDAFGYAAKADTRLPYLPMQRTSYCVDVPASPLYNRIVDTDTVGTNAVEGATETMRLDLHNGGDVRYREGFVIEHNPDNVAGGGSCIFAHLWRSAGEPTAGCTAMEPAQMTALLAWLDPQQHPLFVLLPKAQYQRLQTSWGLPALQP